MALVPQERAHIAASILVCAALLSAAGCASEPRPPGATAKAESDRLIDPIENPYGVSASKMAQAAILPLGTIPYDNMALPLVSPDGRFIATQTGAPPTWPTALAEPGAQSSQSTRIEIYELDRRKAIEPSERRPPALVKSVSQPSLLGRSCDAEGFLIEVPQADGSRWIGKALWKTAEVLWLVTDGNVNAFAALGPGGRLAWSRRAIDAERFDLVVRASGGEWATEAGEENWLMPSWAESGSLFVFALNEQADLELRYGAASDARSFHQSLRRFRIASQATPFMAYQAISGQGAALEQRRAASDHIVFFHPGLQRMAVWRPLAASGERAMHLNAGSIAAVVDAQGFAFVSTGKELLGQSMVNPEHRVHLAAGAQIPRVTASADWPFVLLAPGESRIEVTAMRLLPLDQAIRAQRAGHAGGSDSPRR